MITRASPGRSLVKSRFLLKMINTIMWAKTACFHFCCHAEWGELTHVQVGETTCTSQTTYVSALVTPLSTFSCLFFLLPFSNSRNNLIFPICKHMFQSSHDPGESYNGLSCFAYIDQRKIIAKSMILRFFHFHFHFQDSILRSPHDINFKFK